jgi:hypothetical protein
MASSGKTSHLADIRCRRLPKKKHHFFTLNRKIAELDLSDTGNKM